MSSRPPSPVTVASRWSRPPSSERQAFCLSSNTFLPVPPKPTGSLQVTPARLAAHCSYIASPRLATRVMSSVQLPAPVPSQPSAQLRAPGTAAQRAGHVAALQMAPSEPIASIPGSPREVAPQRETIPSEIVGASPFISAARTLRHTMREQQTLAEFPTNAATWANPVKYDRSWHWR